MKKIIFNSSMPRACSTLLQNIFNQRYDTYATPTDGLLELLDGARQRFTDSVEFKASEDQDLMLESWRGFCNGGLNGYINKLTNKEYVILKGRGYKGNITWLEKFLDEQPKIICMVRNLKSIVASFEKLHRKNPDKTSQWLINGEVRGTTVDKRVDMYLNNIPLNISLDRIKESMQLNIVDKLLFIKAEALCMEPDNIMNEVYNKLGMPRFIHNFDNIEQTTKENDTWHGLDNNLHTIKNKITPLEDNYEEILGKDSCDFIDKEYNWYQEFFGY